MERFVTFCCSYLSEVIFLTKTPSQFSNIPQEYQNNLQYSLLSDSILMTLSPLQLYTIIYNIMLLGSNIYALGLTLFLCEHLLIGNVRQWELLVHFTTTD